MTTQEKAVMEQIADFGKKLMTNEQKMETKEISYSEILTKDECKAYKKFYKSLEGSGEYRAELFYEFLTKELVAIHNKIKLARALGIEGVTKYPKFDVQFGYYGFIEEIKLDDKHYVGFMNVYPEIWVIHESGGSSPLNLKEKSSNT